jgi:hypothetical protein
LTLPDNFKCPENTVKSLISTIYPLINIQQPDPYFANRIILASCNVNVDEMNKTILATFPEEKTLFFSADSIKDNIVGSGNALIYPVEYSNQIDCSALPLHQLDLKIGCPVMV